MALLFVQSWCSASWVHHARHTQAHVAVVFEQDTADVQQWENWSTSGTLYGFTTNPIILQRDGVPCTLAAIQQLVRKVSCAEPARRSPSCVMDGLDSEQHTSDRIAVTYAHTSLCMALSQAQQLRARELQVQSWGANWQDLTANALKILDMDFDLVTVRVQTSQGG